MSQLIILCLFAFLAGFIDSIAGGGGLIQLPALLVLLPNTAIPLIFGTNKVSSIAGTLAAAISFSQKIPINWLVATTSAIAAFIFSFLGARTVSIIQPTILRPVVLVILCIVAVYTFFKKDFGVQKALNFSTIQQIIYAIFIGSLLGFYDGFLGPGTGSFLIFAFVGILGFDFLTASATAKIINASTNIAAIVYFAFTDNVIYHVALPMALCNMLGAHFGVKIAILKGSAFIRVLFIVVVSLLILKLAYDVFFG